MLIIQMPESGERKRAERRRRNRALLYLVPGPLTVWAVFASSSVAVMTAAWAVELWWLWAVWTDPKLRRP